MNATTRPAAAPSSTTLTALESLVTALERLAALRSAAAKCHT